MLQAKRFVWEPSVKWVESSRLNRFLGRYGFQTYDEAWRKSVVEPDSFWRAVVEDMGVHWFTPFEEVLDTSQGVEWAKWFLGGRLNISYNCLDRHTKNGRSSKPAFKWVSETGETKEHTYSQLHMESNRVANALTDLGVTKGDRVALYMPMLPETVISLHACFKIGAVVVPIFSGFGAEAVSSRLENVQAKLLITVDGSPRRGRIVEVKREADGAVARSPSVKKVVVVKRAGVEVPWNPSKDVWWHEIVQGSSAKFETSALDSEDYSLILYTSGTTGRPKGAVHTHVGALVQCAKEVGYYFDIRDHDVFFWVTDIGWMMGPWMMIGASHYGGTFLLYEGAIDHPSPDMLWRIIEEHEVTILGISPTAIRSLRKYGDERVERRNFDSLRILGSTGEPWDQESWLWYFEKVGKKRCPVINISGGTEIIGCFLAPPPTLPQKPTALGKPCLGMDVDVFDENGNPIRGALGYLVCKNPAPSMTKGFWGDPQRYIETYWSKWPKVWYHGDWASVDEDGYWYLHGRADDVIKVAGKRLGPAELESVLMDHPSVVEAAAVGIPDEVKGEVPVCYVVLRKGVAGLAAVEAELKEVVAKALGKPFVPHRIHFVSSLPKTRSGKIVRGLIRRAHLGQRDFGDTSTLENPEALREIMELSQ